MYVSPTTHNSWSALLDPELSINTIFLKFWMNYWNYFRNFYLVFLSVSQRQGIAPCYAILE